MNTMEINENVGPACHLKRKALIGIAPIIPNSVRYVIVNDSIKAYSIHSHTEIIWRVPLPSLKI